MSDSTNVWVPTVPEPDNDGVLRVRALCPDCGSIEHFDVPRSGMDARRGGATVADAFASLPTHRHEQLTTGRCPGCQVRKKGRG